MLRKLWIEVRSSLWFVPGLLVLLGIGLALGLIQLDLVFADTLKGKTWQPLLNTGAEGARGMLTAIAGSMITVAGVAFSITIVTLSLASSQYTPRILRNFMRDRANQIVLGAFVAIFAYCIVVLRTIRGGAEANGGGFVPLLAVAFAVLLALFSIGCLVFFIHHVAASIQASSILQAISEETLAAIEKLFPEEVGAGEEEEDDGAAPGDDAHPAGARGETLAAATSGYLQHVDLKSLRRCAREHGTTLRLACGPGDFVAARTPLLRADGELDGAARDALRACFVVGDFRTVEQDVGFGIRQLVDIALKALSPGINDTNTAVCCLDYLGVLLARLADRRLAPPAGDDDGEDRRVLAPTPTFADHVARTFDEVRLAAGGNVSVMLQMFRVLARVAGGTRPAARRTALLTHARLVADAADRSVAVPYDRQRVNAALLAARAALGVSPGELPAMSLTAPAAARDGGAG